MPSDKPILNYQPANKKSKPFSRGSPLFVLFIGLLTFFTLLAWRLNAQRQRANRVKCVSSLRQINLTPAELKEMEDEIKKSHQSIDNLHQIADALDFYVYKYHALPDSWTQLVYHCDIAPECFIFPLSDKPPDPNASSYFLLFENQPLDFLDDPDRVIAYEDPDNPKGYCGIRLLLADGRVVVLFVTEINNVLDDLRAGHNPPQMPPWPWLTLP